MVSFEPEKPLIAKNFLYYLTGFKHGQSGFM